MINNQNTFYSNALITATSQEEIADKISDVEEIQKNSETGDIINDKKNDSFQKENIPEETNRYIITLINRYFCLII